MSCALLPLCDKTPFVPGEHALSTEVLWCFLRLPSPIPANSPCLLNPLESKGRGKLERHTVREQLGSTECQGSHCQCISVAYSPQTDWKDSCVEDPVSLMAILGPADLNFMSHEIVLIEGPGHFLA